MWMAEIIDNILNYIYMVGYKDKSLGVHDIFEPQDKPFVLPVHVEGLHYFLESSL